MAVARPGVAVTGLYSGPGPLPEPPIGVSAFGDDPSRGPTPGVGRSRAAGAMIMRRAGREARGPLSPARAKSGLPLLPRRKRLVQDRDEDSRAAAPRPARSRVGDPPPDLALAPLSPRCSPRRQRCRRTCTLPGDGQTA